MMNSEKRALQSLRVVAIMLVVGGIAGIAIGLAMEATILSQGLAGRSAVAAFMGAMVCLFGFSTWTGIELWRKKRWAFTAAQILLVAQIPYISWPAFAYQFYTALQIGVEFSRQEAIRANFGLQLGSQLTFKIPSGSEGFIFGINLAAFAALFLLGKARGIQQKTHADAVVPMNEGSS